MMNVNISKEKFIFKIFERRDFFCEMRHNKKKYLDETMAMIEKRHWLMVRKAFGRFFQVLSSATPGGTLQLQNIFKVAAPTQKGILVSIQSACRFGMINQ